MSSLFRTTVHDRNNPERRETLYVEAPDADEAQIAALEEAIERGMDPWVPYPTACGVVIRRTRTREAVAA